MGTGDIPRREDLAAAVGYLKAGLDGQWTVREWQEWSAKAFGWCLKTTRGCLMLLERVRALEAQVARLQAELERGRRSSAAPVPIAPAIVPAMRPAHPPPPIPEARAVSGLAGRPPTDIEAEVLRRVQQRLPELIADEWREASQVQLEAEEWREVSRVQLEAEEWAVSGETVFEPPR